MTTEELKKRIEQEAGVPANLLTGETAEENIAQAKALLAFKKKHAKEETKTNNELFAEWVNLQEGKEPAADPATEALKKIENSLADPAEHEEGKNGTPTEPAPQQIFASWANNFL